MNLKFLALLVLINAAVECGSSGDEECDESASKKLIFCYFLFHSSSHAASMLENSLPCTHIVFAFGSLDIDSNINVNFNEKLQFKSHDELRSAVGRVRDNNPCIKALFAVGGWDEGSEKFSVLAENSSLREKFADNLLKFLIFYGFDGVDLHWMYPTKRGGIIEDTFNFLKLIKLVKTKLSKRKKLVVAALGAKVEHINDVYGEHIPQLCEALDFVLLMTYDYNEKLLTSFGASLQAVAENIQKFISKNCTTGKIVMGISTYGKVYRLRKSSRNEVGVQGVRSSDVEYHKICTALRENSSIYSEKQQEIEHKTVKWEVKTNLKLEKYAFHGKHWVSYEDHETVAKKAKFAMTRNLAGLMFYTLNGDDSEGNCGFHFPLVTTARKNLA